MVVDFLSSGVRRWVGHILLETPWASGTIGSVVLLHAYKTLATTNDDARQKVVVVET